MDDFKKIRESKFRVESKDKLAKVLKKKIQTTMIGALSTVEENFGFLWTNENGDPLTKDQEIMKNIYNKIRSEILDRGNNQARNIDAELSQYEIECIKYQIKIPVINPNNR
jgi:hypothetical protein